jgi:peptidoglycan/LPS O-acetylase OafA/YrhL
VKALLDVAAIGTRLISGLIGVAIAASFAFAAFLAAADPLGVPFTAQWKIFLATIGVGLVFAFGYIMFAIGWRARFASRPFRAANAVLLLLPLTVLVMLIKQHRVPFVPSYAAVIAAVFTASLLLLCARPWLLSRQAR